MYHSPKINGTESYDQTNPWHERMNRYFQENDAYRHPTTATMSGWVDWPDGHEVMDMPQVHLYHELRDPIEVGAQVAEWTTRMWSRAAKPNWIGEYGLEGQQYYPELMDHANWAALAAGAAITPIEWNDGGGFGRFDEEMGADMARLARFVEEVPLVTYDPESVEVSPSEPMLRGWGVVGESGGVIWVQDFSFEGGTMDEIRGNQTIWSGASLVVTGESPKAPGRFGPTTPGAGSGWIRPPSSATRPDAPSRSPISAATWLSLWKDPEVNRRKQRGMSPPPPG